MEGGILPRLSPAHGKQPREHLWAFAVRAETPNSRWSCHPQTQGCVVNLSRSRLPRKRPGLRGQGPQPPALGTGLLRPTRPSRRLLPPPLLAPVPFIPLSPRTRSPRWLSVGRPAPCLVLPFPGKARKTSHLINFNSLFSGCVPRLDCFICLTLIVSPRAETSSCFIFCEAPSTLLALGS